MFTVDNKIIHTDFTKDPFLNFLWLNEIKHPEDYNTRDIMPYYDIEKQDISKTLIISGENLEEYYWNGLFDNLVSYTEKLICFGYELFHPRYEFYFDHMDLILKKYNKTQLKKIYLAGGEPTYNKIYLNFLKELIDVKDTVSKTKSTQLTLDKDFGKINNPDERSIVDVLIGIEKALLSINNNLHKLH